MALSDESSREAHLLELAMEAESPEALIAVLARVYSMGIERLSEEPGITPSEVQSQNPFLESNWRRR